MTDLESIRDALNPLCLVESGLNKNGCKVKLDAVPKSRIVVDFDRPGSPVSSNDERCDYLAFVNGFKTDFVIPIELMKGRLDSSKVVVQLQAGANFAQNHISRDQVVSFRPVAVTGSAHKYQREKLRNSQIKFHGKATSIDRIACGSSLSSIISFEN